MSVPRGPGSGIPGDGKPSLAVTGVSPRKGKDRDGVGKGTDASYHRRNTTPDTVLDPPRASAGLEDFPEDPVVEAAEESEEEDEGYQGSEHSSTSRFATSEIAAVLVPDPIIPGLVRVDVPGLRVEGPCHRSCCGGPREWLAKQVPTSFVLPPLFPGADPTVVFGVATEEANRTTGLEPWTGKLCVRFGGVQNNGVKAAMKTAGFRVASSTKGEKLRFDFNVAWNGCLKDEDYKRADRYQRINHFPATWELGRKDRLGRNLIKARRRGPEFFDIQPKSFLLPADKDDWRLECTYNPDGMYILKPPASSRGRGIRMYKGPKDIKPEKNVLIQRYIRDPHLINGYKYDIRVYVALTSLDPLRVYVYKEGLVRLATEKYTEDGEDLKRRCMHLTNYTINSKREGFTMGESATEDNVGFKWSLSALRRHFEEQGLDYGNVWSQIKAIVTKTMMAVEGPMNTKFKMLVQHRRTCFEVFGFDIMLDSKLRAWLIEVNTGPSLSAPSKMDLHIKHKMVANLFNLVGIVPYDRAHFAEAEKRRRMERITGVSSSGRGTTKKTVASRRDFKSLGSLNFHDVPVDKLPEVIVESEAELARAGEFDRCFPSSDPGENDTYLENFEFPRFENALLCRWERHKHALRNPKLYQDDSRPNTASSASRTAQSRGSTPAAGATRRLSSTATWKRVSTGSRIASAAPLTIVSAEPFRAGQVPPRSASMVDKLTASLRRLSGVSGKKPAVSVAPGLDLTGVGVGVGSRDESGVKSSRPVFR